MSIHAVTDGFNRQRDYRKTLEPLRALSTRDQASGIEFARIEKPGDSKTTAVLHFNPFGNGLSDNMLLRAAYCDAALRAADLRDEHGRSLPFITMAAPTGSQRLKLQPYHHQHIARGQLDTLALHYLELVIAMGYRRLAIIGFSQGASLAVAAAASAERLGIGVAHLAIGEPANVIRRKKRALARDFFGSSKHLPAAVKAINMPAYHEAHRHEKPSDTTRKIIRKPRLNYSLLSGLSRDGFEIELGSALHQGIPVTLSYGDLTTICPPPAMKAIVARIRQQPDYKPHSLHVVEVTGGHHAWADTLDLLATFYAYGLTR